MRRVESVLEGTWEEIARQSSRLTGKRLRVEVLSNFETEALPTVPPFYATATRGERIRALREYAASHRSDSPPLSDAAISRESIYFGEE